MAKITSFSPTFIQKQEKKKLTTLNPTKNSGSAVGYIGANLGLGAYGMLEGTYNLLKGGASSIFGGDQGNKYAQYLFSNDQTSKLTEQLNESYNPGKVMQFAGEVGQGIGQSSLFYLNATGLPVGSALFFAGAAGRGVSDAVKQTGQLGWREYAYGMTSGAIEAALEELSGVAGAGIGKGGKTLSGQIGKMLGKVGGDTAKNAVRTGVVKHIISGASSEFFEEFVGEYADTFIKRAYQIDPDAQYSFADAVYAGLVGAASGGIMEGVQSSTHAAYSHYRGSRIIDGGKADNLLRAVKTVNENVKSEDWSKYAGKEDSKKASEYIGALMNNVVAAYNAYMALDESQRTSDKAKLYLGEMEINLANLEAAYGASVYQDDIAAHAEDFVEWASKYTGETFTAEDIRNNKDNILRDLAAAKWAGLFMNGLETVGQYKMRWVKQQIEEQRATAAGTPITGPDLATRISSTTGTTADGITYHENSEHGVNARIYEIGNDRRVLAIEDNDGKYEIYAGEGDAIYSDVGEMLASKVSADKLDAFVKELAENYDELYAEARSKQQEVSGEKAEKGPEKGEKSSKSAQDVRKEAKTGAVIKGRQNVVYATEADLRFAGIDPSKTVKKRLSYGQKATAELMSRWFAGSDYKIVLFEGSGAGVNGAYRGDTLYLDVNASMLQIAAHELVHSFVKRSPAMYESLKDFVIKEEFKGDKAALDAAVADITEKYKKIGDMLDRDSAIEEIVAKSCERVFSSVDALKSLFATDKKLFKSANKYLAQMTVTFEAVLSEYTPGNEYAKAIEADVKVMQELRDNFAKAMQASLRSEQEPASATEGEVLKAMKSYNDSGLGEVDRAPDGEMVIAQNGDGDRIMYSVTTFEEYGRRRLAEVLKEQGYSKEDTKIFIEQIERRADFLKELAETYKADYSELYGNLYAAIATDITGAKQVLSALVTNGEYPVNIDLQLICKKRVAYMKLMSRLLQDGVFGKVKYDGETIALINKILAKAGYETACLGCFVESRRQQLQAWAELIAQEWNDEVRKVNPDAEYFPFAVKNGEKLSADTLAKLEAEYEKTAKNDKGNTKLGQGSVKTKMGALLQKRPSLARLITADTLLTPDGLKAIRTDLPGGGDLISLIKSRYGAASPKLVQEFNPYNSELADLSFAAAKALTGQGIPGRKAYEARAEKELAKSKPVRKTGETKKDFDARTKRWKDRVAERAFTDYLFDIGGARIQSFSDFMIENVFDYFQIMGDLAARRLPMHGYTKEIIAARLFGMTGTKWNGSLIAHVEKGQQHAGLMTEEQYNKLKKNGKIPKGMEAIKLTGSEGQTWYMAFDDYARHTADENSFIQSIGMKDIMALILDPRYSGNVGNITIGVSDEQIIAMLRSPYFRMVIPYHASGMLPEFAKLVGTDMYTDYTTFQNTRIGQLYDLNGNPVDSLGGASTDSTYVDADGNESAALKADTNAFMFNERLQAIGDAKATADAYLAWCRERHEVRNKDGVLVGYCNFLPKFSGDEKHYDFTQEENYYKLLEDFDVYDAIDDLSGKKTPAMQHGVEMIFPGEGGSRTLTDAELDEYRQRLADVGIFDKADIDKIINNANLTVDELIAKEVESRSKYKKFADENWESTVAQIEETIQGRSRLDTFRTYEDFARVRETRRESLIEYEPVRGTYRIDAGVSKKSYVDSDGDELSADQAKYFKKSKIRDSEGHLLKVYHGTDKDFTVFDRTKGRSTMDIQGSFFSPWEIDAGGYGPKVRAYYLNITNPAPESIAYRVLNRFKGQNDAGVKAREALERMGYDGVNNGDEEYIAFYPEQIKLVDNKTPTQDKDVRYSFEEDEEYLELARDPRKNKKRLSEMVEQEARRKGFDSPLLYHGTQPQGRSKGVFGFTSFDPAELDDGFTIFLTDNDFVAESYSGTLHKRPVSGPKFDAMTAPEEEVVEKYNELHAHDDVARLMTPEDVREMRKRYEDDIQASIESTERLYEMVQKPGAAEALGLTPDDLNVLKAFKLNAEQFKKAKTPEELIEADRVYSNLLWPRSKALEMVHTMFVEPEGFINSARFLAELMKKEKAQGNLVQVGRGRDGIAYTMRQFRINLAQDLGWESDSGIYSLYAKTQNFLTVDGEGANWDDLPLPKALKKYASPKHPDFYETREIASFAREAGYSGVKFKDIVDVGPSAFDLYESDVYAVFNPSSVKSADPVTYDANGDVIPLSERFNPENDDIRYSIAEEDQEYMSAVESGDERRQEKLVKAAAERAGYTTPKLYHGTPRFGFPAFELLEHSPYIYTSSDRSVAANYAGDQHYAFARPIGTRFRSSTAVEDVIANAKNVYGTEYREATTGDRRRAFEKAITGAAEVADKLGKLRVDMPDAMTESEINAVAWVENLMWQAQAVRDQYWDSYFDISDADERRAYRDEWAHDVELYKKNRLIVQEYRDEHRNELTAEQRKYLSYLLGYEVGDAAIDLEYSLQRAMSDKDVIISGTGSLAVAEELQAAMEETHKIGAYVLYGNLGDNPFEFDAGGAQFYALKVPQIDDEYHSTDAVAKWAKENGYTSVIMRNIYDYGNKADNYVFFNTNDVKSADNVTYDDFGRVIPLSERFRPETDDLRHSYAGTAYLTEERVDKYLKDFAIPDQPTRSQAWIGYMDPKSFIPGTTDIIGRSHIYDEVESLDVERLKSERQPIFFTVKLDTNGKPEQITGHEGRHRMTAMGREGIWRAPVILFDGYENWEDNRQTYASVPLFGQGRGTDMVFVHDAIPLDYAHREDIIKQFSELSANDKVAERIGRSVVKYSAVEPNPEENGSNDYTAAEYDEARTILDGYDALPAETRVSVMEFLRSAKGTKADRKTLRAIANIIAESEDLDVRFADTKEKGAYIRSKEGWKLILLDSKLESAEAIRKTLSAEVIHMAEEGGEGYEKFARLVIAVTSPEEQEKVMEKYREFWKERGQTVSKETLLHEAISELGSEIINDYDIVSKWSERDRTFVAKLLSAARKTARSLFGKNRDAYRQAAQLTALLADAIAKPIRGDGRARIAYELGQTGTPAEKSQRELIAEQARAIGYFTQAAANRRVDEYIRDIFGVYFDRSSAQYIGNRVQRDFSKKVTDLPPDPVLHTIGKAAIAKEFHDALYTAVTAQQAREAADRIASMIIDKSVVKGTDIKAADAIGTRFAEFGKTQVRKALADRIYDALRGGEAALETDRIKLNYENLSKRLRREVRMAEDEAQAQIEKARGELKATLQAIEQIARSRRQYKDGQYKYQGSLAAPEMKLLSDAVIAAKSRGGFLIPEAVRKAFIAFNNVFRIDELRTALNEEYEVLGMNVESIRDLDYLVNQIVKGYDEKDEAAMQQKLSQDELDTFADVARAVAQLYRTYNKYYDERRKEWIDADETARRGIDNVEATGRLREADPKLIKSMREFMSNYGIETLDPLAVARMLDGYADDGVMTEIMTDIMNAENAKTLRIQRYMQEVDDFIKRTKGFEKHLTSEADMVDYRGTKLTRDEFIQLYMTSFRKQALLHLGLGRMEFGTPGSKYGLRIISPYIDTAEEATGSTEKRELSMEDLESGSQKVVAEIRALGDRVLTAEDKEYIRLMEKFYNEVSTKDKSDTDYKYFGMTNVNDDPGDRYVPIVTSSSSRASSVTDERSSMLDFATLSGQSFNKNTVKGAKNPLSITGAYQLMQKHANGLAAYVELYAPMQKLDRIWSTDINHNKQNSKRLRDYIKNLYGENSEKYIRSLMGDIQGINTKKPNAFNAILGKLRSNYAIFQLGANPKTWFNQLGSMGALYRFCDLDSILRGIAPTNLDKMAQYSDAAAIREGGDVAVKAQSLTNEISGKVKDLLMRPIGWSDMRIVGMSWGACQYQVQKEKGYAIGTEENLKAAGELLNRVINESQDTSLASTKTGIARSDNEVIRSLAMFRSAPFKQYSRMADAIGRISILNAQKKAGIEVGPEKLAQAKRELARTGAGWALQAAIGVAITALFHWLYKKDDEMTAKDVAIDYASELIDVVPVVGDAFNYLVSGYDLSYFAFDMLNEGMSALQNTAKTIGRGINGDAISRQDIAKVINSDATALGQFFGIPTRNIKNFLTGITKRVSSIFGGTLGYQVDAAMKNKSYVSDLKAALESGNDRLAETIVQLLYSDKKATTQASERAVSEVVRLYGEGYTNVLPPSVSDTITVDGVEYKIGAKEQKKIRSIANGADSAVTGLISSDVYKGLDDADRAKAIKKLYSVYYDRAISEVFGMPMSKDDAISRIGDEKTVFAAASHIANITSDKDSNGKVITNSRKNKVSEYIKSLGVDSDTQMLILYAAGYSSQALLTEVSNIAATANLTADEYAEVYGALGLAS